jgi:hypothetical protein
MRLTGEQKGVYQKEFIAFKFLGVTISNKNIRENNNYKKSIIQY